MRNNTTKDHSLKERNNRSPFVVDLRQAAAKFEKELKKEEKIVKKKIQRGNTQYLFRFLKNIGKHLSARNYFSVFFYLLKKPQKNRKKTTWRARVLKERNFAKAIKSKFKKTENNNALALAQEKITWYRSSLAFFLILCFLIIPFKFFAYFDLFNFKTLETKILSRSQMAMSSLMAATGSVSKKDFQSANSNFKDAGENFLEAQKELNLINDSILFLASLSSDPKIKLAAESKNFLMAGALTSSLGSNLVLATDSLLTGNENKDFLLALNNFSKYGQAAVSNANDLKNVLVKIKVANLPPEYQEKFSLLNKQAAVLTANLKNFVDLGINLQSALGVSRDKRYLLVFQNNSELRASGGFLGSYALVDFRDGKIRNLEVPGGGSYDTEAGLNFRIVAPEPLWLVNPLWHFWDANWWPDWPTTAKNLMWFYEKSGGPSVDGVISVTPTVIERLLEITGPIDLTKEYGLVIDSNNFWETTQKVVEQKNLIKTNPEYVAGLATSSILVKADLPLQQDLENNADNKPKKIIGDLMVKILEILPKKINQKNLVNILSMFQENLSEKQILFYFNDSKAQQAVSSRNWAGEVKATDHDYLMVVNTNVAGQKTDRKIIENIDHYSEVSSNGVIINTLKITRKHSGVKNEPLVGVRNVNWMRIYVPVGSKLISANGFTPPESQYLNKRPDSNWLTSPLLSNEVNAWQDPETGTKVYLEDGKTVFANWTMVDPGQSVEIVIKYQLPFNFFTPSTAENWLTKINKFLNPERSDSLAYSLLLQKQPGSQPDNFHSHLILPEGSKTVWQYPANLNAGQNWEINTISNGDKYWSILTTHPKTKND